MNCRIRRTLSNYREFGIQTIPPTQEQIIQYRIHYALTVGSYSRLGMSISNSAEKERMGCRVFPVHSQSPGPMTLSETNAKAEMTPR
jgi:hypothetical protein